MRIAVYCDGAVVVTVPRGMGLGFVNRLVAEKAEWIFRMLERFKPFQPRPRRRNMKHEFFRHKAAALAMAQERVAHWNAIYGFAYNKINIKNQKTRWGSCSRKGNLNFNYKIALLPERVRDYIIVHEICHLAEFNHSKKFWSLVARAIPDYVATKHYLRRHPASFAHSRE
jgi:hypothetical protein